MVEIVNFSYSEVRRRFLRLLQEADFLRSSHFLRLSRDQAGEVRMKVYAIPNGGLPVGAMFLNYSDHYTLVEDPCDADLFVDDLVDSGSTRDRYMREYPDAVGFLALVDKPQENICSWISFPWERQQKQDGPQDNVRRILQYLGEDCNRDGLLKTPDRVVRSWDELFAGYKRNPGDVITVFEEPCDEMVVLRNVEFISCCEHHMLPFHGKAHIAYIPNGKVIGVSKLARILEIYCRRLQVQERICQQVTEALDKYLHPLGAACVLEGVHLCMVARGVSKQSSVMVTSSMTGAFREKPEARNEFLSLIRRQD